MADDALENSEEDGSALRQFGEEQQAKATALQAENTVLRRDASFRDAGLDLANPLHQAVMKGYDGDLESDKVAEYVTSLSLATGDAAPPPPPDVPPDEQAALDRVASASDGTGRQPAAENEQEAYNQEMRDLAAKAMRGEINQRDLEEGMLEISRRAGRPTVRS